MTTRLVWFLIFLSALTAVATLGSFKKVFNSPTREVIALKTLEKMPEEKVVKNVEKKIDEVALGKEIYVQAQCVRCHGANGDGVPSEEGPMLAGQHDWYVYDKHCTQAKRCPHIKFSVGCNETNCRDCNKDRVRHAIESDCKN